MPTSSVERVLYRSLLRTCRGLDKSAVARSLLSSNPEKLFDRLQRRTMRVRSAEAPTPTHVVDSIVGSYLNGEHYKPGNTVPGSASLLLRSYFLQEEGDEQQQQQQQQQQAGSLVKIRDVDRLDCAFEALRRLQNALSVATECVNGSVGGPRGQAASRALSSSVTEVVGNSWVQSVDGDDDDGDVDGGGGKAGSGSVDAGHILLCSPVSCLLQPVFHQVAILITEAAGPDGDDTSEQERSGAAAAAGDGAAAVMQNQQHQHQHQQTARRDGGGGSITPPAPPSPVSVPPPAADAVAALAAAVQATGEHQYQAKHMQGTQRRSSLSTAAAAAPTPSSYSSAPSSTASSSAATSSVASPSRARGVSGVILNRPTNSTLGDFLELTESPYSITRGLHLGNGDESEERERGGGGGGGGGSGRGVRPGGKRQEHPLRCFADNRVFKGGDCLLELPSNTVVGNMMVLHPYADLEGSQVVIRGTARTETTTPAVSSFDAAAAAAAAAAAPSPSSDPWRHLEDDSTSRSPSRTTKRRPLEVGAPSFQRLSRKKQGAEEQVNTLWSHPRVAPSHPPTQGWRRTENQTGSSSSGAVGSGVSSGGVYASYDLGAAAAYCEAGKGHPRDFFIFYGYCGWESDQLRCELERNIWYDTKPQATKQQPRGGEEDAWNAEQQQQQQHPERHQTDRTARRQEGQQQGEQPASSAHAVLKLLSAVSERPALEDGVWGAAMASLGHAAAAGGGHGAGGSNAEYSALGESLGGVEASELLGRLDERSVLRRYDDLQFVEDVDTDEGYPEQGVGY